MKTTNELATDRLGRDIAGATGGLPTSAADCLDRDMRARSRRPGLTLVELLVVIIILTTLVATVIPVMVPSVQRRRLREAARGVSAFFGATRARAIKTGRPAGVWIERMDGEPGAAITLFVAEVPPPYAGPVTNATVQMRQGPPGSSRCYVRMPAGMLPPKMVRVFDIVRVNHQGYSYRILGPPDPADDRYVAVNATQPFELELEVHVGDGALPWPSGASNWSAPVSFQIFRQPVRTSAPPYQLPSGTVIDLDGSGEDQELFDRNPMPVIITFAPDGGIDYIHHGEANIAPPPPTVWARHHVTGPIHLLIGKRENVREPDPTKANWLDLDSLWVSIAPQTGQVATAENAPQDPNNTTDPPIIQARRFAREMHGMGGK